jgi:hypothetical protein
VLVYSTVTNNASIVDTVQIRTDELDAFGSIIAQPGDGNDNCFVGTSTTSGFVFSDDADGSSSCLLTDTTDLVGAGNDPDLGPMAGNGGETATRLPLTGSPVIDAIPVDECQDAPATGVTTDQRGLPRPAPGGGCDIGSVEVQPPTPPTPPAGPPAAEPIVAVTPNFTG